MNSSDYLEKILRHYQSTFDLKSPYVFGETVYSAYGYFYSHSEKYVLTRSAQMWETNSYEHVFFTEKEAITHKDLVNMDEMFQRNAEPVLVRKNEKYPQRNHMYTYLTYVILSNKPVKVDVAKSIQSYHFSKSYMLSIRGWCEARIVVVDLAENMVYTNKKAKPLKKIYKKLLLA